MPAATSSRFRRRNLNFKTHLAVVREADLDEGRDGEFGDGEGPEPVSTVKTGVDEVEERVSFIVIGARLLGWECGQSVVLCLRERHFVP